MKYFFSIILALSFFFTPSVGVAQQGSCSNGVGDGNYSDCCSGDSFYENQGSCIAYENTRRCTDFDRMISDPGYRSGCCSDAGATINQGLCSASRSGATTGPSGTTNSGLQGIAPVNVDRQLPGTIAATPRTTAKELQQCSAIRFDSLLDILIWLKCIIGVAVIPLLFTLTFLVFLWGMFNYIRNASNEKKREESKQFIYWGILGLTVMVGVWGIVRIVTTTFGLGNTVPQLQSDCLTTDKNNPCR